MKKRLGLLILLFIVMVSKVKAITVYDNSVLINSYEGKTIDVYGNYLDNDGFEIQTKGDINVSYVSVLPCVSGEGSYCQLSLTSEDGLVKIGELTINVNEGTESKIAKVYLGGKVINISINNEIEDILDDSVDAIVINEEEYINLLQGIKSEYVNIVLEDKVFEYDIEISSNINKLDLEPIAYNSNTKIEISSQVISELDDGKIIINVSNGDREEEYIINVKVIDDIKKEINISPIPKKNYSFLGICVILVTGFCSLTYFVLYSKRIKRRRRRNGRN